MIHSNWWYSWVLVLSTESKFMFWDNQAATNLGKLLGWLRSRPTMIKAQKCTGWWKQLRWGVRVGAKACILTCLGKSSERERFTRLASQEKNNLPGGRRDAAQQNQPLPITEGRRSLNGTWHLSLNSSQVHCHQWWRWSKGWKKAKPKRAVPLKPLWDIQYRPHEFGITIIQSNIQKEVTLVLATPPAHCFVIGSRQRMSGSAQSKRVAEGHTRPRNHSAWGERWPCQTEETAQSDTAGERTWSSPEKWHFLYHALWDGVVLNSTYRQAQVYALTKVVIPWPGRKRNCFVLCRSNEI